MLAQDTLDGIGGDSNALVVEDVCQTLLAKAWVLCLGLQDGIYDTLRFGGAVDTGRAIKGCQTPLLGFVAIFIKGLTGDAEEPGDHDHTEDLRSDQSQYATFEVVQLGRTCIGRDMEPLRVEFCITFHLHLLMSTVTYPFDYYSKTKDS